jgi:hypothetical protein
MSEWSNRLGVRILCLSGATDWVSGYYVWVEQQTGILTPSLLLHLNTISWHRVCCSTQTQYPDTQSIAPLRHNILTPSLLLHSDIISWHPVCCSTQTQYPDTQSVAPLRHNILTPSLLLNSDTISCQDIMSEWSNRLGVRILCLRGATDWVSGYCVWVEQQTWCKDIMSEWRNRLDTISSHPVCCSTQTQYPDTQSVAPLRHNILTPSLLLHSDTISWHPEQQTGCQDIVSEWSNRLGVRILCLSGEIDWVSEYYVWVEQQTECQDIVSEWSNPDTQSVAPLRHNILTPSLLLHSDIISWHPVYCST